jgi:hypothetical protein
MQCVSMQGSAPRVLPRSKLSDAELAACRVQYDALVSAMRELATRHSLNVANVLGERVRQRGSCLLQAASRSLAACLCCRHSKSIQTAISRRPQHWPQARGPLMRDCIIPEQRSPVLARLLVAGEGVAPGVLEQVRELVQSGCRASQDLERKGGIQVRGLDCMPSFPSVSAL